ncbi:nickel/cobalt transporter [Sinosporangium siamense]|nr:High-affinity nickel-transporter [Sinosporangium siamense]
MVAAALLAAHPLGNFTVNHYNGLRVTPDRVENLAIVDSAELPALQAKEAVERAGAGPWAARRCEDVAGAQRLTIGGVAARWRVVESGFTYMPGEGGLPVSRLTCRLTAPADLPAASVEFEDGYLPDRPGWRETTAVSEGVRLTGSSVPAHSISQELRSYPDDLLATPPDQRSAAFTVTEGEGTADAEPSATFGLPVIGPVSDLLAAVDRTFTGLVGAESLTVPLGSLAVLLAALLGAGHALIPGHGKTIMAAYLAGRRGRPRDALIVGATVTLTHTLGVLAAGLALSLAATLTGETLLTWLGTAGGLLIAAIGCHLLRTAWRDRAEGTAHAREFFGHGHGHGHGHGYGDDHGHGHGHGHGHSPGELVVAPAPVRVARGRAGLVGMGVAGGLVPSPSALIVLLGAVALGRTWFGVALVAAYGLGMAATLTATGLLLVGLADRLDRLTRAGHGLAARVSALTPLTSAAVVVVLGAGLAVRNLTGVL